MSKLLQFPDQRSAEEQAASWLVSLEEGMTAEEVEALEHWLAADPTHGRELVRLARIGDAMSRLAALAEFFPLERYARRPPSWLAPRVATAALAVAGVTGIASYLFVGGLSDSTVPSVAGPATSADATTAQPSTDTTFVSRSYATAVGERFSTRLTDGSTVTLNTNTLLDVEYATAERLVVMQRGEAIFRVASDPDRPFRVRAGNRIVEAVGTVFNVRLFEADDIRVTVAEGRVKVAQPATAAAAPLAAELTLDAGNLAMIRAQGEQVEHIEPEQIEASLAWEQGMVVYRGETLAAVLADMGRYTTVRFVVADDTLRDRRVGGYFRAGDIDGLLLALHESFGIEQSREGDTITLSAGP